MPLTPEEKRRREITQAMKEKEAEQKKKEQDVMAQAIEKRRRSQMAEQTQQRRATAQPSPVKPKPAADPRAWLPMKNPPPPMTLNQNAATKEEIERFKKMTAKTTGRVKKSRPRP